MKEHVCSKEMWGEGTRYTKRDSGGGKFKKLWLYAKLTDHDELMVSRKKASTWQSEQWQLEVIFSDEAQVVIGQNNSFSFGS